MHPAPPAAAAVPAPANAHPLTRAAQAVGIGIVAALPIGFGAGLLTFVVGARANCSVDPSDGWCGLGWFIIGVGIALLAAAIAYIAAGVVWVCKHEPDGRRAAPITMHLLAPFALTALLGLVGALQELVVGV